MKSSLFLFTALLVSMGVYADASLKHHQELCQSNETKALMGPMGTCQIVAHTDSMEGKGVCRGQLRTIPCEVRYAATSESAEMSLICGPDLSNPMISQDMQADAVSYRVNAVIKTSEGKSLIRRDQNNYHVLDGNILQLSLKNAGGIKTASIVLQLKTGPVEFTEVLCE